MTDSLINSEVIILYQKRKGFCHHLAKLIRYDTIYYDNMPIKVPIFLCNNRELSGTECFWITSQQLETVNDLIVLQKNMIALQHFVHEYTTFRETPMIDKISDTEFQTDQIDQNMQQLKDLKVDPFDYRWVEDELATSLQEKRWFAFQREKGSEFGDAWNDAIMEFNTRFKESITLPLAVAMTKRWKRLLMGAWFTLASQNPNKVDWKESARRFERYHREIEERMNTWSLSHEGNFPLATTKIPVKFWHGPYFNQCIEKIPHLFTDAQCAWIKENVPLRIVSYDNNTRFIRLDFTKDIRALIKPNEDPSYKLWFSYKSDYNIRVSPSEIDTHLNIMDALI